MELDLVWIYFLVLYSDFSLGKDVIETDGIPSLWKRRQEIINNPDHHKISTIQDKKPTNEILNYGLGIQRHTQSIPSNQLLHKIMQSTKNATDSNLNSISDSKLIHNNENINVENKNTIYDKQQHNINKYEDQVLKKCPKDTKIENIRSEFKNGDTFEKPNHADLDVVHEKEKLTMLLPQKNDTSSAFVNKFCRNQGITKSEEPQEHEDGISHNMDQNKNVNNDDLILKSHDLNRRKSVNSGELKNYKTSHDDQPIFLHAIYNPRGWIRHYKPNQYSLSNHSNNNINELYSKTKYSNPFYVTQSPFTRHLSYGADKRYRRPDVRYQIRL